MMDAIISGIHLQRALAEQPRVALVGRNSGIVIHDVERELELVLTREAIIPVWMEVGLERREGAAARDTSSLSSGTGPVIPPAACACGQVRRRASARPAAPGSLRVSAPSAFRAQERGLLMVQQSGTENSPGGVIDQRVGGGEVLAIGLRQRSADHPVAARKQLDRVRSTAAPRRAAPRARDPGPRRARASGAASRRSGAAAGPRVPRPATGAARTRPSLQIGSAVRWESRSRMSRRSVHW